MPSPSRSLALIAGFALHAGCAAAPGPSSPASPPAISSPPDRPPASCPPATPEPARLTREQALRDLRILERTLTELHPGLFRYLTAEGFAAEMARARAAVEDGSDVAEMYLLASRIAAAVRCGHTWTNPLNQTERVQAALFGRADKLPVRVRLVEDRLLVTASATPALRAGAELLAIDGRQPPALVAELLPYLRADGSSDGKRRIQLNSGDGGAMDRLFPLLHPPRSTGYALLVRDGEGPARVVVVPAMTAEARDRAALPPVADQALDWTFTLDGDTAILTLPTFALWNSDFDWRGFLARSFEELEARRVPYLILDQRRNEGGASEIVEEVLGYLIAIAFRDEPRRAEVTYERVPYALARYLDTWDTGFFDRTGHVIRGPGRNSVDTAATATAALVQPKRHRFTGKAFVLVGAENSSAGFQLARAIQQTGAATLVGQPTGGNQRGLNGGQLAWVTLPESGVAVDVPLVAWMPPRPMPDAGITPELLVTPRFEDARAGRDAELAAARAAIAGLRRSAGGLER